MGQHEATQFTVQGEAFYAIAQGQHQHGLRAIDRVTGGDLLGTGLEEGFFAEIAFFAIALRAT
ncbi:hypothetical protein D9M68_697130 [compost metagenome]